MNVSKLDKIERYICNAQYDGMEQEDGGKWVEFKDVKKLLVDEGVLSECDTGLASRDGTGKGGPKNAGTVQLPFSDLNAKDITEEIKLQWEAMGGSRCEYHIITFAASQMYKRIFSKVNYDGE